MLDIDIQGFCAEVGVASVPISKCTPELVGEVLDNTGRQIKNHAGFKRPGTISFVNSVRKGINAHNLEWTPSPRNVYLYPDGRVISDAETAIKDANRLNPNSNNIVCERLVLAVSTPDGQFEDLRTPVVLNFLPSNNELNAIIPQGKFKASKAANYLLENIYISDGVANPWPAIMGLAFAGISHQNIWSAIDYFHNNLNNTTFNPVAIDVRIPRLKTFQDYQSDPITYICSKFGGICKKNDKITPFLERQEEEKIFQFLDFLYQIQNKSTDIRRDNYGLQHIMTKGFEDFIELNPRERISTGLKTTYKKWGAKSFTIVLENPVISYTRKLREYIWQQYFATPLNTNLPGDFNEYEVAFENDRKFTVGQIIYWKALALARTLGDTYYSAIDPADFCTIYPGLAVKAK